MSNKSYNGHRNWTYWNVSLWVNNDEPLYRLAQFMAKHYANIRKPQGESKATFIARQVLNRLKDENITQTPDGAVYTVDNIRAAMRGIN